MKTFRPLLKKEDLVNKKKTKTAAGSTRPSSLRLRPPDPAPTEEQQDGGETLISAIDELWTSRALGGAL
jgi:hypothetical protein